MKISLNWLRDFVDIKITPADLAEQVSLKLTEVGGFTKQAEKYDGVICVRIDELKRHPNSDHLWLVKVFDGVGEKHIVCGAQNLAVGQIVPLALVKEAVIRGEKSEGMLCSAKELDLGEDHSGIYILSDKIKPGTPVSTALNLDDVIFEIENKALTHRGDCFSHLGIAREVSAITKTPLNCHPDENVIPAKAGIHQKRNWIPCQARDDTAQARDDININIENPKDCPRYMAARVTNVKIGPSPEYIQRRLTACGMRPINNIVDFTNYVMLELGQPLHAFDLSKLPSSNLGVRRAKENEGLETLDGNKHQLTSDNLVITSNDIPVAVAGVMGGASSEISDQTTNIIIEAANFDNYTVRRSSRQLGVRTEASMRYEKNLDPNLAELGLARILELIKESGAGECKEVVDEYPSPVKPTKIQITTSFINDRIGVDIDPKDIVTILSSLGLTTSQSKRGSDVIFEVTVPTFRRDLIIPEDLIEEISRIYGYQKITPRLPFRTLKPIRLTTSQEGERLIKTTLKELGYHEVYSYSFIGKSLAEKATVDVSKMLEIVNPLSPELKFIRSDLFPGLLEKIALNSHNFDHFRLFEVGREIIPSGSNQLPLERLTLVGGAYIKPEEDLEEAFRAVKGDLAVLFNKLAVRGTSEPFLKNNLILFKIYLDELFDVKNVVKPSKYEIPTTMPIIEDISFYVALTSKVGPVLEEIKKLSNWIKSVEVFDVYKEKDKKSIAIKITYQDDKMQLSDKEVAPIRNKVLTILTQAGFEVRKS